MLLVCSVLSVALTTPALTPRTSMPRLFFGGGQLPAEVAATLDPGVPPESVVPLWRELRKCYPTERAAIDAAVKNQLVLLPFLNRPDHIKFCFQILKDEIGFDDAERLEIITRNPGVLANKPCTRIRVLTREPFQRHIRRIC